VKFKLFECPYFSSCSRSDGTLEPVSSSSPDPAASELQLLLVNALIRLFNACLPLLEFRAEKPVVTTVITLTLRTVLN